MKVITNNKPRKMLYGYELPESVKADFDYLDREEMEFRDFIFYRGNYYDIGEFMSTAGIEELKESWTGYSSDSYFSGVVIKMVDCDSVICGRYLC